MTPESPEMFYLAFIESIYQLWKALGDELDDQPVDPMHRFLSDVFFFWSTAKGALEEGREPPILRAPVKGLNAPAPSDLICIVLCTIMHVLNWAKQVFPGFLYLFFIMMEWVFWHDIYLHRVYHICQR